MLLVCLPTCDHLTLSKDQFQTFRLLAKMMLDERKLNLQNDKMEKVGVITRFQPHNFLPNPDGTFSHLLTLRKVVPERYPDPTPFILSADSRQAGSIGEVRLLPKVNRERCPNLLQSVTHCAKESDSEGE